jgi:hypothetical protein
MMHLVLTSNPDALARSWRDRGALHVEFGDMPRAIFRGGEVCVGYKLKSSLNALPGMFWTKISVQELDAEDMGEAGVLLQYLMPDFVQRNTPMAPLSKFD